MGICEFKQFSVVPLRSENSLQFVKPWKMQGHHVVSGLNGGGGYLLRLIMIDFKGGSFDCVFDEVLLLFDIS